MASQLVALETAPDSLRVWAREVARFQATSARPKQRECAALGSSWQFTLAGRHLGRAPSLWPPIIGHSGGELGARAGRQLTNSTPKPSRRPLGGAWSEARSLGGAGGALGGGLGGASVGLAWR